jgi:Fe2+ or Zn2+ uptake regulation protein
MGFLRLKLQSSVQRESTDASRLPNTHLRLTCVVCGRSEELAGDLGSEATVEIRTHTGFHAELVTVNATGKCRTCSQKESSEDVRTQD